MVPRSFLVAVDDSEVGAETLRYIARNLYRDGDMYHVVHLIPKLAPPQQYGVASLELTPEQDVGAYREMIMTRQQRMFSLARQVLGSISPAPQIHLLPGDTDADSIGQLLCDTAEKLGVSMMVLTTRHSSLLKHLLMGSVIQYCLDRCSMPTLVYYHPEEEDREE